MSDSYSLLGLDTLERIVIGDEKSAAAGWGLWDHQGPVLNLVLLGGTPDNRWVMLSKDMLEKLYDRFAAANPKGTVLVWGQGYEKYAPPGLSRDDLERMEENGELFAPISYGEDGFRRLRELLPELTDPTVLARLATDPALDAELMDQARQEGALSDRYGPRHQRWSPEWDAYVIAYRAAHPDLARPQTRCP
jgi:hypothetical protein